MDRDAIIRLEVFIFRVKKKPIAAAGLMADIIGVLIDLKPTMIGSFGEDELGDLDFEKFKKSMREFGLKGVYFKKDYFVGDMRKTANMFCISKRLELKMRSLNLTI